MQFVNINKSQTTCWISDWFELQALCLNYINFLDHLDELVDQDTYNEDIDEEESSRDNTLLSIDTEIRRRASWLVDAYPFTLENGGLTLSLSSPLNEGQKTYILCLWLSAIINGMLSPAPRAATLAETRLFQLCATVASAAFMNGKAFSFGFPRLEGSGMLEGLQHLQTCGFTEGIPKRAIEAHMNSHAKDDEVDIIAWRPKNDALPGTICLYGQVASGANWESKPLSEGKIKEFQNIWYEKPPVCQPITSIFIPVCPWDEKLTGDIAVYTETLRYKTYTYGIIFSRYRIPYYVHTFTTSTIATSNITKDHLQTELENWFVAIKSALMNQQTQGHT